MIFPRRLLCLTILALLYPRMGLTQAKAAPLNNSARSSSSGYWGVAMSLRSNSLILPLDIAALKQGWQAVEKKAAGPKAPRKQDYIAAMETYYQDPDAGGYTQRVEA
jgi:hypothetical protein